MRRHENGPNPLTRTPTLSLRERENSTGERGAAPWWKCCLLALAALLLAAASATAARGGGRGARAQAAVQVVYHAGWNLVGAPQGTIFTGVAGDLLSLANDQSGYVAAPDGNAAEAGQGYWAYFAADTPLALPDTAAAPFVVDAPARAWLLVGNPTARPVRIDGASAAYGYDPATGYTAVDLLPPGRGALVYSEDGGAVTLTPAANTIAFEPSSTAPPAAAAVESTSAAVPGSRITVVAQGFGQSRPGAPIAVGMLLRNDGAAAEKIPITMTVYDANGLVIGAADTTLHYLGAGETTGLVHRLSLRGTAAPAHVEVQAGEGRAAEQSPPGTLRFSQESLTARRSGLEASALLTSGYDSDLSDVHLSAVVYDAGGAIVGGGTTTKRLVPADSSIGVVIPVDTSGTPARVEFYAQLP